MLGKEAKSLSNAQVKAVLIHLKLPRNPVRNRLIFLLSIKAGLRAKDIAGLTWRMVTDAQGEVNRNGYFFLTTQQKHVEDSKLDAFQISFVQALQFSLDNV